MKTTTFKISGMHCASCANNIKSRLEKHPGVKKAQVNFTAKNARVDYSEAKIKIAEIEKIIEETGYGIVRQKNSHNHNHHKESGRQAKFKAFASLGLALPLVLKMLIPWQIPGSFLGASNTAWAEHTLAFIVVFFFGWQFHINAYKALKRRQTDMDTLISLGTLAAYFYSLYAMFAGGHLYFEGAAAITALILLGRYLETKTRNRASRAMQKLLELGAKEASIIKDGQEIVVKAEEIKTGDVLLVRPGEKIPLDGIVIEGAANVDESMISGESLPVAKEPQSQVFGATINQDGILKIKVTKDGENTLLAQIIKTVEEAQNFKAPTQRLADRISAVFVPAVVGLSALTFVGWIIYSGNLEKSILNAVSVLVISCPCALGIATPIAIMVGSSVGAKNGILIKNGESFEKAKTIDTILFDKTGTLTMGKPTVHKILNNKAEGFSREKLLKIAYSLSSRSKHPLSRGVAEYGQKEKAQAIELDDFKEIPGQGISGRCRRHGAELILGNYKLLSAKGMAAGWANDIAQKYKQSPYTILFVAHGQSTAGAIFLSDQIKESSARAITETLALGIEPVMISGDNRHAVAGIASLLGIKNYLSEVLPADKQKEVKKIQSQGKQVIFAGDGINDAPALASADLGIAMAGGTDIAKESGDIIIMKNEPIKIVEAILLSQKTFKVIKMNLFWAFFYNALAIPLAMLGLVNPMFAALAMSLSDITVIGNSLRLYKK